MREDNYIVNYYCDSTKMHGEDAWVSRALFENNFSDENICSALAKCLIRIIEEGYMNE